MIVKAKMEFKWKYLLVSDSIIRENFFCSLFTSFQSICNTSSGSAHNLNIVVYIVLSNLSDNETKPKR